MINSKTIVSISLITALANISFGQIVKTNKGYLFHVKYTAGQTIQFDSSNSLDNKNKLAAGETVNLPVSISVLSVDKGYATTRISMGAGTIGKNPKPIMSPMSVMVQVDDHNNSKSKDGNSVVTPLPTHPVQIGATWNAVRPVKLAGTLQRLDAVYQFAGPKQINGHEVAVINFRLSGAASGSGTMMLLTKDGSLYRNETFIDIGVERVHSILNRKM